MVVDKRAVAFQEPKFSCASHHISYLHFVSCIFSKNFLAEDNADVDKYSLSPLIL
jgi:hypothetical protein